MILVDTSVLIGYLRGDKHAKITLFDEITAQGLPYGISPFTYMEIIQGAKDEKEFAVLKKYVGSQTMYILPQTVETFETAARIYFTARRKGVTLRGTMDVLIALTAVHFNLFLLLNTTTKVLNVKCTQNPGQTTGKQVSVFCVTDRRASCT